MLGRLTVRPLSAQLYVESNNTGYLDPYVSMSIGNQHFRTAPTIGQDQNPSWNEAFTFDILEDDDLHIVVVDKLNKEDFMARTSIRLSQIILKTRFDDYFDLKSKYLRRHLGQIHLAFDWFPNKKQQDEARQQQSFANPTTIPQDFVPQSTQMRDREAHNKPSDSITGFAQPQRQPSYPMATYSQPPAQSPHTMNSPLQFQMQTSYPKAPSPQYQNQQPYSINPSVQTQNQVPYVTITPIKNQTSQSTLRSVQSQPIEYFKPDNSQYRSSIQPQQENSYNSQNLINISRQNYTPSNLGVSTYQRPAENVYDRRFLEGTSQKYETYKQPEFQGAPRFVTTTPQNQPLRTSFNQPIITQTIPSFSTQYVPNQKIGYSPTSQFINVPSQQYKSVPQTYLKPDKLFSSQMLTPSKIDNQTRDFHHYQNKDVSYQSDPRAFNENEMSKTIPVKYDFNPKDKLYQNDNNQIRQDNFRMQDQEYRPSDILTDDRYRTPDNRNEINQKQNAQLMQGQHGQVGQGMQNQTRQIDQSDQDRNIFQASQRSQQNILNQKETAIRKGEDRYVQTGGESDQQIARSQKDIPVQERKIDRNRQQDRPNDVKDVIITSTETYTISDANKPGKNPVTDVYYEQVVEAGFMKNPASSVNFQDNEMRANQ
jgi:hypothetical protein